MEERRLRDVRAFWNIDDPRPSAEGSYLWPADQDKLLREPVGCETWFYPISDWVANAYERLTYYSMQYHRAARDLVNRWLNEKRNPETFVYAIAFLYRQAIELRLKAIVASTPGFDTKSVDEQRLDMLGSERSEGHDLDRLWKLVEARLPLTKALGENDTANLARLLHELTELDRRADGFRFPFEFNRVTDVGEGKTFRIDALSPELGYQSADNFVHVLEAIANALDMIPGALEEFGGRTREMRLVADDEDEEFENEGPDVSSDGSD